MPARITRSDEAGSFRTQSLKSVFVTVNICETLATESFVRPLTAAASRTLPGASSHLRFDVNGTQTTVAMRLLLILSL